MEKTKLRESLKLADFTQNEIDIYLTLIDYGISKIGTIVKVTGLQKSSCYMAINTLLHKGIITQTHIGEVAHFQVDSPQNLLDYIDEKRNIIRDIIPDLKKRQTVSKNQGTVKHFKGTKGIKAVFNDILREGKDNQVFGSEGQLSLQMPVYAKQYIRQQNEKKIHTKNLTGLRKERSKSKNTSYRYVPKEIKSNVVTNIYGDKIAILIWTEEPEAIIIENKIAADSYRSYFEFMWKNADK
jgi:HTH-type transcriptional regulator, sugar sensing transcriptional regulator